MPRCLEYRSVYLAIAIALAGVVAPARTEVFARATSEDRPWKSDRRGFVERMARVQKGWSEKQLIDWLGAPDGKSENRWSYRWRESTAFGGFEVYWIFTITYGVVAKIESDEDHRSVAPPR
jgi:hypothetical protein